MGGQTNRHIAFQNGFSRRCSYAEEFPAPGGVGGGTKGRR